MENRVEIAPELFLWACERAQKPPEALGERFPKLPEWIRGSRHPTFRQLERFAEATHTPVGYFFLPQPVEEPVPIPDMRTMAGVAIRRPSANLLDTIYLCQQRQAWYREFMLDAGEKSVEFIGSASLDDDVVAVAARMREALEFDLDERRRFPTWQEALRRFIQQADELGVLVMVSGIVGSNTRRKLDPEEFRGFALADDLAPLVFINGADSKSAQMFTLAHELAHLWLGETALSDATPASYPSHRTESWCNRVAAELLVPGENVADEFNADEDLSAEMQRLARQFKVSTLVILRRIHDTGGIGSDDFHAAYRTELQRLRSFFETRESDGGSFYHTQAARVGKRFARAVASSVWEGRSSFTEAFRLLGVRKMETFRQLSNRVGVVA